MEWSRREVLGSVVGSFGAGCRRVAVWRPEGKPEGASASGQRTFWLLPQHQHHPRQPTRHRPGRRGGGSKAGFHAIEPWITELDAYTKGGGNLKDLGRADRRRRAHGRERHRVQRVSHRRRDGTRGRHGTDEGGHGQGGADWRHADRRAAGQQPWRRQPRQRGQVLSRSARDGREDGRAAAARAVGHASAARAAAKRDLRHRRGRPPRCQPAARRLPHVQERHAVHQPEANQRRRAARDAHQRLPAGRRPVDPE